MSLYWVDQECERIEIREDTEEVRAQGGQEDTQQAFRDTLETKSLTLIQN